ncbi:hypothetical protein EJB05_17071, partial [Eragrostis curvula]
MDNGAMKQTVVLYPPGGAGHVGPMTQLAKVFLEHGYDVTMVLLEPPFKSTDLNVSFIESIVASNPSISFHVLPPIPPPDFASSPKHPFLLMLEMMIQYNEKLESFLRSFPRGRLHSLVVDMFCVNAIDVAWKLDIPVFTFFASGAGALAVLTQLPNLIAGRQTGLKELGDTPLEFLGSPPMPASHIIKEMLEHPEDELCKTMLNVWKRNTDTHGVLVNTFESLESRAAQAFRDPLCSLSLPQNDNQAMKQTIVLYPGAGVGHVVPMAELAKVFLNHGYDVSMVVVPPPFESSDPGAGVVERIAADNPSITFHVLRRIQPADSTSSGKHPFLLWLQMLRQYNEKLENFLCSIPRHRLHSLVVDMFGADAIDVATKLDVPVYTFVPSGASPLAVLTQVSTLLASRKTGLKELGETPLEFLGVPPMPASHLVKELLEDPEDELCKTMASLLKRGMETRGVLVNTFESLESRALQAFGDPRCVPGQ